MIAKNKIPFVLVAFDRFPYVVMVQYKPLVLVCIIPQYSNAQEKLFIGSAINSSSTIPCVMRICIIKSPFNNNMIIAVNW